ncbi:MULTISPECIES: hypothetical protein [Citricoccus]|uniref:hypothetical protein n=1 Tax=Citricoccus TaxID=169133 RepID=UPI000255F401|nr:hypothetical protein [Citricoccus sp. CH26A]
MRTALSLVLAVLAGLLASLALAGARLEALVHTPGPLQRIAGPMSEDPRLRAALPGQVTSLVRENLPAQLPSFLQEGLMGLVQGAVDGLVHDDRFPDAWAQTLEQTRVDWVERLEAVETGAAGPADATVHLHLAPLADLGVERLSESVEMLPGGEAVGRAVREGAEQALGDLQDPVSGDDAGASPLVVDLNVPDPAEVSGQRLAQVVSLLPQWPWLAGGAVAAGLLALLTAPRGRRWGVLVAAGATAVLAGVIGWWALGRLEVTGVTGLARIAAESLTEGVRQYALPDTVLLMAGGALVAALGGLAGLFSRGRSGRRR